MKKDSFVSFRSLSWVFHVGTWCTVGMSIIVLLASVWMIIVARRLRSDRLRFTQRRRSGIGIGDDDDGKILAFFHPHCSGGGGGERVLWMALHVLGNMVEQQEQQQSSSSSSSTTTTSSSSSSSGLIRRVIIYTIDPPTADYERRLWEHVHERFSIRVSDKLAVSFVHLHDHGHLLRPASRFSLLVESIGAMRLAWHGLHRSASMGTLPHVFCDTTGCAFTFLPASLWFGCTVLAYVHYPTISTDMLRLVWEQRRRRRVTAYDDTTTDTASSRIQSMMKLIYYIAFAVLYGMVGSCATVVMVNSTWTYHHIHSLWKGPAWRKAIRIVYPPCAVQDLQPPSNSNHQQQRLPCIVSIGQFRPEKDHVLQLHAMARLLEKQKQQHHANETALVDRSSIRLIMIGSCRNEEDEMRLSHLRRLTHELGIASHVEFCVNEPYPTIKHWLGRASVGLHTMWNEHFGIGIVEMMAAGLLVVAHDSGGPRTDIITPHRTGFLAATADEYATAMHEALTMPVSDATIMRAAAVQSSRRFSDEVFHDSFRKAIMEAKIL